MGGAAKKNLRVFREICGDNRLGHVRIVTTNWNFVDEKLGSARQDALANGAFGPLINEGACLCRHDKGLESARSIMSQLIHQKPVKMMIQEELNAGWSLGDTSAGALIVKEMKELKKKHDKEVEMLKKELEEASKANDEDLRLELAEERRKLEEIMTRAEEDRKTLKKTLPRETLPKPDAGKQTAATVTVLSVPFPLRYHPQSQGNETTDRGSQLQQVLHDTRRVQLAVPIDRVPPPARHRHHPQRQGVEGDDTAVRRSQPPHDTWMPQAVPSVLPPAKNRHHPQRQGNETTDRGSQLQQDLHDTRRVTRVQLAAPRFPPPARHSHHPQRQGAVRKSQQPQVLLDTRIQPAVPSVSPPPKHRHREGNTRADRELHLPQVLHDMVEVVRGYSKAGGELLGRFGAVAGGFVGLCFSPFIIARRSMSMDRL